MALTQETNTVIAARSGLQSVPDYRSVAYPESSLPHRWSATVAGAVALVVGAWGGIVPYIGHALHYSADGSATWTWNLQHGLLSLLPGAMAVLAGALLMATAWLGRKRVSILPAVGLTAATVILGLSAVWFLIGSSVWPIYFTGHVLIGASPARTLLNVGGTYLAESLILAAVAGVVGTWAVRSLAVRSHRTVRVVRTEEAL
jgi:hypothetical protein